MATARNDLGFDEASFTMTTWIINPDIGSGSPSDKQLIVTDLGPGAYQMSVEGNGNSIPDGPLYLCELSVSLGTTPGSYSISNAPAVTDADGNDLPVAGAAGVLIVTTCLGDCDAGGTVSMGEVVKAINIFLGQPMCTPADPPRSCPTADADHNGTISLGEVMRSVDRFLGGC